MSLFEYVLFRDGEMMVLDEEGRERYAASDIDVIWEELLDKTIECTTEGNRIINII